MSEEAERFLGFSVPDDRRVEHQLTEEEIIFCDKAEKLLFTDMKKLTPTSADDKEEHLYLVPPRKKLFLQKNSTSPIHETRYTTTDMDHVLGVHVDSKNSNINYSLSNSFINQSISCFARKKFKSVDC